MKEYGYMDGDYLRSRFIEPRKHNYIDSDGVQHTKLITEDEQIATLSPVWKPVDGIDNSKVESAADGYIVVPVPYDCGDHIGYRYVTKRDLQRVRCEIQELKESLANSDYQIIKCYEASLAGEQMPYDIADLHSDRQKKRSQINELEALL